MASARSYLLFGVVLCLGSPAVWAQSVTVNTSLTLTGLTITASDATVNFTTPGVSTYAQALDSLGGSASQSGTTSASAATSVANGSGTGSASALTGGVTANVFIPDNVAGFASSEGDSSLVGAFEITGTLSPVDVTFTASLSNDQYLNTDANGQSAYSETIFLLSVPNASSDALLGSDNLLTLSGPNQSAGSGGAQPLSLTTTILLQPNTPYSFTSTLDAEANGYGVLAVPDGSDPVALVLVALGLSAAFCGLITRKPRPAERG